MIISYKSLIPIRFIQIIALLSGFALGAYFTLDLQLSRILLHNALINLIFQSLNYKILLPFFSDFNVKIF